MHTEHNEEMEKFSFVEQICVDLVMMKYCLMVAVWRCLVTDARHTHWLLHHDQLSPAIIFLHGDFIIYEVTDKRVAGRYVWDQMIRIRDLGGRRAHVTKQ